MSSRVFLHIGAPKTGTTYLQDRMARNAKQLAAHGVHFPSTALTAPDLFHFRAALDLLGQDWGGRPGHARGAWESLVRKVRRSSGTVVISHEILAPAPAREVARVKEALAGAEVHVVYSARDLGRQVPAAWQESVKQGRTWSYARFCARFAKRKTWFARAFDLPSVLGTWGADLPPERVHVLTVPRGGEESLWERWCRLVGIDPAWAPEDAARANTSLGMAETQLLRRLNKELERTTRNEVSHDGLIREMLDQDRLVDRRSARVELAPAMHPWVVAETERWVEWIEGSRVDVVGDLADLAPAPPLGETEYRDPDRVRPKHELRAAVDALAAMTREAARRDDPDAGLVARVRARTGRAADRP